MLSTNNLTKSLDLNTIDKESSKKKSVNFNIMQALKASPKKFNKRLLVSAKSCKPDKSHHLGRYRSSNSIKSINHSTGLILGKKGLGFKRSESSINFEDSNNVYSDRHSYISKKSFETGLIVKTESFGLSKYIKKEDSEDISIKKKNKVIEEFDKKVPSEVEHQRKKRNFSNDSLFNFKNSAQGKLRKNSIQTKNSKRIGKMDGILAKQRNYWNVLIGLKSSLIEIVKPHEKKSFTDKDLEKMASGALRYVKVTATTATNLEKIEEKSEHIISSFPDAKPEEDSKKTENNIKFEKYESAFDSTIDMPIVNTSASGIANATTGRSERTGTTETNSSLINMLGGSIIIGDTNKSSIQKSKFSKFAVENPKDESSKQISLFVDENEMIINNYISDEYSDDDNEDLLILKYKNSFKKTKKVYWAKKTKEDINKENYDDSDEDSYDLNTEEVVHLSDSESEESSNNSDLNELIDVYQSDYKASSYFTNVYNKDDQSNAYMAYSNAFKSDLNELNNNEDINKTKITDFQFKTNLNKGGYGRVDLYIKKNTKDIYAIKTVNIANMVN